MKQLCLPAEWHKQIAVQLTWPHGDTDWAPYLDDIIRMELEMAYHITMRQDLTVATPEPETVRKQLAGRLSAEQMERVTIYETPTNDTWARDHAAITLLPCAESHLSGNESGHNEVRLLDFHFNGWGDKFAADKDNNITGCLYTQQAFHKIYGNPLIVNCDDFVLEGGAIESDGEGTVFTTSFCLMAPHRNQPLTQQQIEDELKNRLHCQRVLWIDHGQLIGDDTDGHIDTTVRIAPDNTLLYVKCYDESDEHYADFKAMEEQLGTFRTIDGKPYRLIPLPMPRPVYDIVDGEEERLPTTYANFLIINGAVLVPTYNQPDLDKQALEAVKQAFPDREIIGIDAQVAVRQHGSLHCLTMQFPEP